MIWPFGDSHDSVAPENTRLYAIGDVHGCMMRLDALLSQIKADFAAAPEEKCCLIFVGDYVDRGPDSAELIDLLLGDPLPEADVVFLKGNHEEFMLRFLEGDADAGTVWIANGGAETLMSYDIPVESPWPDGGELEALQTKFAERVPDTHRSFLRSLELYHVAGDYAFVHAGVRPGLKLTDQTEKDLLWIRDAFLSYSRPHEYVIVHGHTPVRKPENLSNRINVDTGAVYGGPLTAVVLAGTDRRFLHV